MHRMYRITLDDNNISNECVYVSYSNLDSIMDCSADHLTCDVIQNIPNSVDSDFIEKLLNKIKPGGVAILKILDLIKISKDYINNNISSKKFLSQISNLVTAVTLDDINFACKNGIAIQQIKYEDDFIIIVLTKNSI